MSNDTTIKIDRRQFVIAGSTGLIGLSMMAPKLAADGRPLRASIGYLLGSEHVTDLGECRNGQIEESLFMVVPATKIPQSNPRFISTGMRVSVWSFRGEDELGAIRSISLTSEVQADVMGKARVLPFHVWSLERAPVRKESSPVGFNATVEFGRPVDLLVSLGAATRTRGVRPGDAPVPDVRFRFSLEDGPDARISRGVYFLGFGPDEVSWDRIRFVNTGGETVNRQLVENTLGGARPVVFPYFVIAIDHGSFFENGA
jgi:hypothetical protein